MAAFGGDVLRCSIPDTNALGVVTRRLPGQAAPQTLVACGRDALRPLHGAGTRGPLRLGPPLELYAEPAPGGDGGGAAERRTYDGQNLFVPNWDPWSAAVYMVRGSGILGLSADNMVTLVAGSVHQGGDADGAGGAARFEYCSHVTADGRGRLYVADRDRIRQLQLPAAWEAGGAAGPAAAGGATAAGGEVAVSTLPLRASSHILDLAFDSGSSDGDARGSLVYATSTAIYRLPLCGEGTTAAPPVLLAGREGVAGTADGRGAEARFTLIRGLVLDGEGCAYVADQRGGGTTAVRQVARDGAVTTITTACLKDDYWRSAVLSNGYLALCGNTHLHVFDLGLSLPPGHAGLPPPAPKPTGPPPRTLAGDWGAVLDRQPDDSSDLTVVAGGCPFHVHQLVLSSRSDYYARCLGSGFAEGAGGAAEQQRQPEKQRQVLNLPDVDPEVFKLALRFMYTGAADVPPALAQGVAELADRLLLPELCAAAHAVVEASVTPSSVVGSLLWAEAHAATSPSFSVLLGRLKGWYAEHLEEVLEHAEESVELLAERNPKLMVQLMKGGMRAACRLHR